MSNSALISLVQSKDYFLFDLDGTLVDLEQLNFTSFRDASKNLLAIEMTYGEYFQYFAGSGSQKGFERYLSSKNMPKAQAIDLVQLYRTIKRTALHEKFSEVVTVKPGAFHFLDYLVAHKKYLALGTSTAREFAMTVLVQSGLLKYFPVIVTVDDVAKTKPDPEIFLKALALLYGTKDQSIIFEDSVNGVESARNSGMDYIVIRDPKGVNDAIVKSSPYAVESYEELIPETV